MDLDETDLDEKAPMLLGDSDEKLKIGPNVSDRCSSGTKIKIFIFL